MAHSKQPPAVVDSGKVKLKLVRFIRETVTAAGFQKVIVGLSGGVDSATVAYLSSEALGRKNVVAVLMPYDDVDPEGKKLAELVVKRLKLKKYVIDIAPMVDPYFRIFPEADRIRRGNKMARERMTILFDLSKKENALVIGSGNRTEILLGYCTLYGDSACALNPLAVLYKTQEYRLAGYLGVPEEIITRPPTAGLWRGQTDEAELGCTYAEIDKLLFLMVDKGLTDRQLKEKGFDKELINKIRTRVKNSEFKRRPVITPKITI